MSVIEKHFSVPGKSATELYQVVDEKLDVLLTKLPLEGMQVERQPQNHQVYLRSSAFNGSIQCMDGELRFEGKLSFLVRPFQSKVEAMIEQMVERHFLT